MDDFPERARPLNTLLRCARIFWHTFIDIESIHEIPVQVPFVNRNSPMNGIIVLGIHSMKRL